MRKILAIVITVIAVGTFTVAVRHGASRSLEPATLAASATPTPTPPVVRVVSGVIKPDGTFIGQGFTVVHPSLSHYKINFSSSFDDVPAVIVQHVWALGNPNDFGGAVMDTCTVEGVDATSFGVACVNNKGQPNDRTFSFIAVRSK